MNYLKVPLILFLSSWLFACGSDESVKTQQTDAQQKQLQAKVENKGIAFEDLNDPAQWQGPRIQYLGRYPEGSKNYAVYSMKLDGSDLRLAWAQKPEKKHEQGEISHPPSRSPDNRWLTLSFTSMKGLYRAIVDLQTGQFDIMYPEGGGPPSFTWTNDSKNVLYWADGKLLKYNVESKQNETLPDTIKGGSIYLLKDQQTLLSVRSRVLQYYNINTGKMLKEVPISGAKRIKSSSLSFDEKYLVIYDLKAHRVAAINLYDNSFVFDENVNSGTFPFGRPLFIPEQNQLIFREGDGISIYNPFNLKKVKSVALRRYPLSGSIINTK